MLFALGVGLWQGWTYYKHRQAQSLNNHGVTLAMAGEGRYAAQAFQDALWWLPSLSQAHANLGQLAIGQGQLSNALDHYKNAIMHAENVRLYHLALGKLHAQRHSRDNNDFESALRHFKKATELEHAPPLNGGAGLIENDPVLVCGKAYNALGILYKDARQLKPAGKAFTDGLRCNPRIPQLHQHLGEIALEEQQLAEAGQHLEHALTLFRAQTPEDWQAEVRVQYDLARVARALKQYPQVCERLRDLQARSEGWWLHVPEKDLRNLEKEAQCA